MTIPGKNQGLSWANARGLADQFLIWWAAARPGPSIFQRMGHGPAQPITLEKSRPGPAHHMAARPMRHGLYMGRPDNFVGRPVDLTGLPMGRPICCSVLKGACASLT